MKGKYDFDYDEENQGDEEGKGVSKALIWVVASVLIIAGLSIGALVINSNREKASEQEVAASNAPTEPAPIPVPELRPTPAALVELPQLPPINPTQAPAPRSPTQKEIWVKFLKTAREEKFGKMLLEAEANYQEAKKRFDDQSDDKDLKAALMRASLDLNKVRNQVQRWLPTVPVDAVKKGDMGVLKYETRHTPQFTVSQVIDGKNMIAHYEDNEFWFEGLSTEGMADGHMFTLTDPIECPGTKQYQRVLGATKTVMCIRVLNLR